jgi:hypothetical protein
MASFNIMASSELHSRNTESGEAQVICPKCGEVNSSNFLFCGMCGTILDPARKAAAPVLVQTPRATESISTANSGIVTPPGAVSAAPPPPGRPRSAANEPTPPISGPSLLGLDQGNVDVLRDRAFSGLASYAQPDEPRSAGKEALLTIVLLAALAGAGWWTYKNYIGVTSNRKPVAAVTTPGTAANTPPQTQTPAPKQDETNSAPKPAAESASAENQAEKATTPAEEKPPVAKSELADTKMADAKTADTKKPAAETGNPPKAAAPTPTPTRNEVSAERVPAAKAADSGEAFFRQGEGYLYGRGGAGNCANAIKYLKMASDKQHAKARSAMGTMYATGHCVPRDLPSSYRWFALALQADPNNTIVEKNLRAVWNQMTPPERQMATKSQ